MKWKLNESKYASGPAQTSSILKALKMEDEKRPIKTGSLNESMQLSGTSKLNGRRNLRRGKENPDNIKTAGNKTRLTGDYDLRESYDDDTFDEVTHMLYGCLEKIFDNVYGARELTFEDLESMFEYVYEHFEDALDEDFKAKSSPKKITESVNEVEGLNAFITNLGKYNEGELVGEWAHFPMDEDDFEQLLQKIGIDGREYEEWFVTDYDSEFDAYDMLGEYPSFEQLNEVGEMVEDVDMEALSLIIDLGYSMEEAIEGLENGDFIIVNGPDLRSSDEYTQIGQAYIYGVMGDDSQCGEMMKNDPNYIDEEAYGRDIRLGGDLDYYEEEDPEFYKELENMSDRQIGQYFIDELGTEGISDSYFDFSYLGRNLAANGEAMCDGNTVVFIFR